LELQISSSEICFGVVAKGKSFLSFERILKNKNKNSKNSLLFSKNGTFQIFVFEIFEACSKRKFLENF